MALVVHIYRTADMFLAPIRSFNHVLRNPPICVTRCQFQLRSYACLQRSEQYLNRQLGLSSANSTIWSGIKFTRWLNFASLLRRSKFPHRTSTNYGRRKGVSCLKTGPWSWRRTQIRGCSGKGNSSTKSVTVPKRSDVNRLFSLAKPERWNIAGAIILLVVSSSVTIAVPFCIGKVIDIIYNSAEQGKEVMLHKLNSICKILLGVFVLGGLANFGRVYLIQIAGTRIIRRVREILFGSIIKQEMAFFDKNKTGELINRLSTDVTIVGQSVTQNISDGLRSTAQAIGGVGMMVYVSPKLTLIALGIVPPVAVISVIYGRYVRKITKKVQDGLAEATQVAEERISNVRTVRAFAQEMRELAAYNSRIENVLRLSYKEALARGSFWGMTGLSGNIIILTVFYYGGLMMTEAQMTVGDLSAFMLYAAYVGISIGGLSGFYTELMRGLGASGRLWGLIDREPAIPISGGIIPQEDLQGNILMKDVYFSYPTRPSAPIFTGLDLEVRQGSVLAVVGPSGSGKSTLASILLRYYDPQIGHVYIDNTDVRDLDPSWLRGHMGVVSQEPVLFSTTIAENIAYGSHNPAAVTTDQIIEASKQANAYNFIQTFPKGLDTVVGERGLLLSGGQRQRVAIARAILKNPKILLLDEATSALDAESEHLVQEALERLMVGRTVITIAHRLSTIKNADQIAVLSEGKVIELGSYKDLMAISDGMFRKLVERQTIVNK